MYRINMLLNYTDHVQDQGSNVMEATEAMAVSEFPNPINNWYLCAETGTPGTSVQLPTDAKIFLDDITKYI